jgi:hypothetical protein
MSSTSDIAISTTMSDDRWRTPEQQSRGERYAKAPEQHRRFDADLRQVLELWWTQRDDDAQRSPRDADATHRAGQREHDTFRQHLPSQPSSTST